MASMPDPNQEPTVAQFAVPLGAQAQTAGSPPAMSTSTFARMAQAAPDVVSAVEALRAGQVPDAQSVVRVLSSMGVPTAPQAGAAPAARPAQRGEQHQPQAQAQRPTAPAEKPHFRDVLNDLGERISQLLVDQLPGVPLGITFQLDENNVPEIRLAAYVPTEDGEDVVFLAENVANYNALGDALYVTVAEAQKKVEAAAPPEAPPVDIDHIGGDY